MTSPNALVRWGAAGLGAATLCLGLPFALATSPASAQVGAGAQAAATPSPCPSGTATPTASPSRSATPTASTTPSATASATTSPSSTASAGGVLPVTLPSAVATVVMPGSASPTASASRSASATPTASTTPSATATASTSPSPCTTASATPTPTTSATTSASPGSGTQCVNPAGIVLDRSTIFPGTAVRVTVFAPSNSVVELQAYSRPSTQFRQARRGAVPDGASSISFDVTPGTNTRLFAQCVGQTKSASAQKVISVRTALSLSVVRNGRRDYTFQGRLLPRRANQTVTLFRVESNGRRIITKQLRSDSSGTYRFRRVFTGSGTFGFLSRTGQNLTNNFGESDTRSTDVTRGNGQAKRVKIQ